MDGPSVGHAKRKARNAMVQIGIRALGGLLARLVEEIVHEVQLAR